MKSAILTEREKMEQEIKERENTKAFLEILLKELKVPKRSLPKKLGLTDKKESTIISIMLMKNSRTRMNLSHKTKILEYIENNEELQNILTHNSEYNAVYTQFKQDDHMPKMKPKRSPTIEKLEEHENTKKFLNILCEISEITIHKLPYVLKLTSQKNSTILYRITRSSEFSLNTYYKKMIINFLDGNPHIKNQLFKNADYCLVYEKFLMDNHPQGHIKIPEAFEVLDNDPTTSISSLMVIDESNVSPEIDNEDFSISNEDIPTQDIGNIALPFSDDFLREFVEHELAGKKAKQSKRVFDHNLGKFLSILQRELNVSMKRLPHALNLTTKITSTHLITACTTGHIGTDLQKRILNYIEQNPTLKAMLECDSEYQSVYEDFKNGKCLKPNTHTTTTTTTSRKKATVVKNMADEKLEVSETRQFISADDALPDDNLYDLPCDLISELKTTLGEEQDNSICNSEDSPSEFAQNETASKKTKQPKRALEHNLGKFLSILQQELNVSIKSLPHALNLTTKNTSTILSKACTTGYIGTDLQKRILNYIEQNPTLKAILECDPEYKCVYEDFKGGKCLRPITRTTTTTTTSRRKSNRRKNIADENLEVSETRQFISASTALSDDNLYDLPSDVINELKATIGEEQQNSIGNNVGSPRGFAKMKTAGKKTKQPKRVYDHNLGKFISILQRELNVTMKRLPYALNLTHKTTSTSLIRDCTTGHIGTTLQERILKYIEQNPTLKAILECDPEYKSVYEDFKNGKCLRPTVSTTTTTTTSRKKSNSRKDIADESSEVNEARQSADAARTYDNLYDFAGEIIIVEEQEDSICQSRYSLFFNENIDNAIQNNNEVDDNINLEHQQSEDETRSNDHSRKN